MFWNRRKQHPKLVKSHLYIIKIYCIYEYIKLHFLKPALPIYKKNVSFNYVSFKNLKDIGSTQSAAVENENLTTM